MDILLRKFMATISDLAKANVIDVIKGLFRPEIEAMNFGSIRINFENIVKKTYFLNKKRDGLDGKIQSFGMKTLFIICAVLSDQKVFSFRYKASKFKQKKNIFIFILF